MMYLIVAGIYILVIIGITVLIALVLDVIDACEKDPDVPRPTIFTGLTGEDRS